MTRQVTEGSPITVTARSKITGGFISDAPLTIDGDVYSDPDLSESFDEHKVNGAGDFVFYAAPGSVIHITVDDPSAADVEPIQVVGVAGRPGGLAAVHPDDTPSVIQDSPLSEHVTDSSLVGAVHPDAALAEEDGGAAAMVGVDRAQNVPPGPPADQPTPDGTTATDPDAVAPAQESQVTPVIEQAPVDGAVQPVPDTVQTQNPAVPSDQAHGSPVPTDTTAGTSEPA